jgi:hypothetical protein
MLKCSQLIHSEFSRQRNREANLYAVGSSRFDGRNVPFFCPSPHSQIKKHQGLVDIKMLLQTMFRSLMKDFLLVSSDALSKSAPYGTGSKFC